MVFLKYGKVWSVFASWFQFMKHKILPFIKSVKYYHNHPKNYCHFKIEQTFFVLFSMRLNVMFTRKFSFLCSYFHGIKKSDTLKMQVKLESNNTKMCVHSLEQLWEGRRGRQRRQASKAGRRHKLHSFYINPGILYSLYFVVAIVLNKNYTTCIIVWDYTNNFILLLYKIISLSFAILTSLLKTTPTPDKKVFWWMM